MEIDRQLEELRKEALELRAEQQTLMNSLTSFGESVKAAFVNTMERLNAVEQAIAQISAKVDKLENEIKGSKSGPH